MPTTESTSVQVFVDRPVDLTRASENRFFLNCHRGRVLWDTYPDNSRVIGMLWAFRRPDETGMVIADTQFERSLADASSSRASQLTACITAGIIGSLLLLVARCSSDSWPPDRIGDAIKQ
ncbi:hypothetical protein X777_05941 [Ooceraea biroi]|uniref:Uncharacterized protein n=1 Tax=Ooceraea biroi TaxID=2015173 RepID=A0A026WDF0_OOCBI|nr:hypothetical protein X777_05941 [Ooceraea biroi]